MMRFIVAFLFLFMSLALSERSDRTPARVLAKQTGAARFEEHVEQSTHHDHKERRHRVKKRSSDEDVDYEVYQGVVGRPGIDFPIFPRIPQTTFSCRTYGNGYFADLETECQVFHICEEGRKISFLCPNGTIFQQSELTCDWWFKVNCAGSPSFYIESSEILHKARKQRIRPKPLHRPISNTNDVVEILSTGKSILESDRRIDSDEGPVAESLDFEDISDDRSSDRSGFIAEDFSSINPNSGSSEVSRETPIRKSSSKSASRSRGRSSHKTNDKLKQEREGILRYNPSEGKQQRNQPNEHELQIAAESASFVKDSRKQTTNKDRDSLSNNSLNRNTEVREGKIQGTAKSSTKNERKLGRKISDDTFGNGYLIPSATPSFMPFIEKRTFITTTRTELYQTRSNENSVEKQYVTPETESQSTYESYSSLKPDSQSVLKPSTLSPVFPGTYSTARKLESTRTTPFYTPTVPSIARAKPTDSKIIYLSAVKPEETPAVDSRTPKTAVIGMRRDNSDIHRFPSTHHGALRVQVPVDSVNSTKQDVTTSTSGPAYLPKGGLSNKTGSVLGNIRGIINTVNVLKDTMKAKDKSSKSRAGLEIPPSSGPGTLVSLTNYFGYDDEATSTTKAQKDTTTTTTTTTTAEPSISASLISNKTSGKYFNLFGIINNQTDSDLQNDSDPETIPQETTTVATPKESPVVVGDFSRTTIRDLAQNPETRKIAQVFSNAITKYIENPETFRKDLINARPTQPPRKSASLANTPTSTTTDVTSVTSVTDAVRTSPKSIKSTATNRTPVTTEKIDATTVTPITEVSNIAKEINSQLDLSTPSFDIFGTDSTEATTYRGTTNLFTESNLSSELLPPEVGSSHELQSLSKFHNQSRTKSPKAISFDKTQNQFDTSLEKTTTLGPRRKPNKKNTTQRPETTLSSQPTIVASSKLDITTRPTVKAEKSRYRNIGQPKVNAINTSTAQESTKVTTMPTIKPTLPHRGKQSSSNAPVKPTEGPWSQITNSIYLDPLTINDGLTREQKTTTTITSPTSTDTTSVEYESQEEEKISDILKSPEFKSEMLPKSSGLQRIANKIFGGLNETEAIHLQNVMKKAEHNQGILRLLLLLIQTCDDQNGRALERSRKILINALIGMDNKSETTTPNFDLLPTSTPSNIPITTYRRNYSDINTTNKSPTTTTDYSTYSTEGTTKFEIHVPDIDDDTVNGTTTQIASTASADTNQNPNRTSDQRALELLKSLYALASKFSRR